MSGAPSWLDLTYAFTEGMLIVGTSPGTLERTVRARQEGGRAMPASLRNALSTVAKGTRAVLTQSTASRVHGLYTLVQTAQESIGQIPSASGAAGSWDLSDLRLPDWEEIATVIEPLGDEVTTLWRVDEGLRIESESALPNALVSMAPLGIVSSVAIPNLLKARLEANETSAIAGLRNIASAQAQFQAMAAADRDQDGVGEYGFLAELAGTKPVPGGEPLVPPLLPARFGSVEDGAVTSNGYLFKVYLAGRGGESVSELPSGGSPSGLDADGAEKAFVVYAWPANAGSTGRCVFVLDESGAIYSSRNVASGGPYGGIHSAPAADAAMSRPRCITGRDSLRSRTGQDGATWTRVE
jgi:type II secretory pathway pseudopilin PulG